MSKVKITVEHDGEVNVYERDASFIVAFSEDDEGIEIDGSLLGCSSRFAIAYAIATSIVEHEENIGSDLVKDVVTMLMLKRIESIFAEEEE